MALKTKAGKMRSKLKSSSSSSISQSTIVQGGKVEWEDAPTELTRRSVFTTIYGDTHTGRTTLALTAPGPIAYFYAAENIEGRIQQFSRDKKIRMANFGGVFLGNTDQVSDAAVIVWESFKEKWAESFTWARSIILDTHTDLWELIRLARFGGLKPTGGRVDANYGPVNNEWVSLFRMFRQQDDCNLILVGKTKDEYTKSKKGKSSGMGERTGNTIQAGQKDIPYMSEVIVRCERELTKRNGLVFKSIIEKGWWNGESVGLELENELSTFPMIMSMITETDVEEWEE